MLTGRLLSRSKGPTSKEENFKLRLTHISYAIITIIDENSRWLKKNYLSVFHVMMRVEWRCWRKCAWDDECFSRVEDMVTGRHEDVGTPDGDRVLFAATTGGIERVVNVARLWQKNTLKLNYKRNPCACPANLQIAKFKNHHYSFFLGFCYLQYTDKFA